MTIAEDMFPLDGDGRPALEDPVTLDVVLTFTDRTGRRCTLASGALLAAFVDLDAAGLVPDPGTAWRESVVAARAEAAGSSERLDGQEGAGSRSGSDPGSDGFARYGGLERVPGDICDHCQAECHALFIQNDGHVLIERWSIVTTIVLLIDRGLLPHLPMDWHSSLGRDYERICETGRQHYRSGSRGAGDV